MSSHRYKVLVLDLDGTTLTREDRILPEDRAAARRLAEAGVQVTIATGRLFPGTAPAAEALGVDGHVAVMNGSEHVHARTRAVGLRWDIPLATRARARQVYADQCLETFLFASAAIHHDRRSARHSPYLRIWTDTLHAHPDIYGAPSWEQGDDVLGICAVGPRERIASARAALEPHLPEDFGFAQYSTFDGEAFLELRHHAEDKATAMRRLAAERGATPEETVAVGDWMNDLPMLRAAGRSFAMRGSAEEVVAAADEVLDADRGQGGAVAAVARTVWGL